MIIQTHIQTLVLGFSLNSCVHLHKCFFFPFRMNFPHSHSFLDFVGTHTLGAYRQRHIILLTSHLSHAQRTQFHIIINTSTFKLVILTDNLTDLTHSHTHTYTQSSANLCHWLRVSQQNRHSCAHCHPQCNGCPADVQADRVIGHLQVFWPFLGRSQCVFFSSPVVDNVSDCREGRDRNLAFAQSSPETWSACAHHVSFVRPSARAAVQTRLVFAHDTRRRNLAHTSGVFVGACALKFGVADAEARSSVETVDAHAGVQGRLAALSREFGATQTAWGEANGGGDAGSVVEAAKPNAGVEGEFAAFSAVACPTFAVIAIHAVSAYPA